MIAKAKTYSATLSKRFKNEKIIILSMKKQKNFFNKFKIFNKI